MRVPGAELPYGPSRYPAQARPDRPEGLRERKKLATRQALGAAAMRLAVERGLENVLVEDIAAAADVSPRTFNNYFASKYEAICALALDRSFRIGEALRERPAGESLWDAVRNAVLDVYASATEAPSPEVIAGIRLVTCSPALRGEYLKALSIMQYELAAAITERTGAARRPIRSSPVRSGSHYGGRPGGERAVALRRSARRARLGHRARPERTGRRHARRPARARTPRKRCAGKWRAMREVIGLAWPGSLATARSSPPSAWLSLSRPDRPPPTSRVRPAAPDFRPRPTPQPPPTSRVRPAAATDFPRAHPQPPPTSRAPPADTTRAASAPPQPPAAP